MENTSNPFEIINSKLDALIREVKQQSKTQTGTTGKEWGDIHFASNITGYKLPTLYIKVSKGQIPHIKRDGKLWFERTTLLKWIETGIIQNIETLKK